MELIDSHCHLDCLEGELEHALDRAQKIGVTRFISIGAASGRETNLAAVGFAEKYANVWATIGFHPHNATEHLDLEPLREMFQHPKVVAIGETGLDFYRDWAPRENQILLFKNSIATAKKLKKPLIIHSRNAREETLKILKEERANEVGGVFHCYSEDSIFAEQLLDFGFYISFTGIITFKKSTELQKVVKFVPLDKILIETDSPYMAPEPYRGKPSEPMHLYYVAKKIAEIKELDLEQVSRALTTNTLQLFQIKI